MNPAASHLASREDHQEVVQYGRLYRKKLGRKRKLIAKEKKYGVVSGKVTCPQRKVGVLSDRLPQLSFRDSLGHRW